MTRFADTTRVPGLSVGVIADGSVLLSEALGSAVPADAGGTSADRDTVYHLASLAKPFVATAVVVLAENGKLSLDDRVVRHLPHFRLADSRFGEITVRQLLLHTSGLPDVDDYGWADPERDDGALERYVRSLASLSLKSAPGEAHSYSNIGYEVLGDVIAKVSGRTFEEFLSAAVFRPLGMRATTFLLVDVPRERLAQPHVRAKAGAFVEAKPFPYNRAHAPSSTLYSTVDDMSRWLRAVLGDGELEGTRVVGRDAFASMLTDGVERRLPPGTPVRSFQHLGWSTLVVDGTAVHGHGGHDRGFRSMMVFAPAERAAVVVMTNGDGDDVKIDGLGLQLLGIIAGKDWSGF